LWRSIFLDLLVVNRTEGCFLKVFNSK
jgi:hypothetical protein